MAELKTRISPRIRDRVLARWGLEAPRPTIEGLNVIYGAWCRNVSFDNVQKRISLVEGHDHLAGRDPDEFFENHLTHGTGGTCWPTSIALAALLEELGFAIRRVVAAMNYERLGRIFPGHASIVATVEGRDWLVDTSMLSGSPFELRRGETTGRDDAVHPMRADPHGDMWIVRWSSTLPVRGGATGAEVPCMFLEEGVTAERFSTSYEATRPGRGPFNTMLVARRNLLDGGVLAMRGDTLNRRNATGTTACDVGRARAQLLVSDFGFSPEIVARLPLDEPPATRSFAQAFVGSRPRDPHAGA